MVEAKRLLSERTHEAFSRESFPTRSGKKDGQPLFEPLGAGRAVWVMFLGLHPELFELRSNGTQGAKRDVQVASACRVANRWKTQTPLAVVS